MKKFKVDGRIHDHPATILTSLMSHIQQWTKTSILEFLNANAPKLYAMGVRRLGLFGSYVRNEQKPDSDIDLLVVLEKSTFDTKFFLEISFGCKVDLVEEKTLKPDLALQIMREVIYIPCIQQSDQVKNLEVERYGDLSDFPVDSYGTLDKNLLLSRENIYDLEL